MSKTIDCKSIYCETWSDNQGFCHCCGKPVNPEYYAAYRCMDLFSSEFKAIWAGLVKHYAEYDDKRMGAENEQI